MGEATAEQPLILSSTSAMPGDTIICTASATDQAGAQAVDSSSVSVENRSPTVSAVSISPGSPSTSALLSCGGTSSDVDGESLSESISWSLGGVVIASGSTLQLSPATAQPGDALTCTVTATDASGDSGQASAQVSIANTIPELDSITLTPANPYNTDTLTCTVSASDADNESLLPHLGGPTSAAAMSTIAPAAMA